MKLLKTAIVKLALATALYMLLPGAVHSGKLYAQGAAHPTDSPTQVELPTQETAEHRDKAKEETESSEEEEIKHSAMVRAISAKLGLSVVQGYWICVLINFGIVFFAVVYGLRKKLPGIFKNRTEAIQKHIEEARRTSEEARSRLAEVETRLSRLDVEIEAMRHQADEGAKAEERRLLAEAEQERKRIVESAEQEIAQAASSARRDLQAYAANLAVDLAGKKIRVGPDTDQALVRDFTSWLGKDGN